MGEFPLFFAHSNLHRLIDCDMQRDKRSRPHVSQNAAECQNPISHIRKERQNQILNAAIFHLRKEKKRGKELIDSESGFLPKTTTTICQTVTRRGFFAPSHPLLLQQFSRMKNGSCCTCCMEKKVCLRRLRLEVWE